MRIFYIYVIGLLALALLGVLGIPYYEQRIPKALEAETQQLLKDNDIKWASVSVKGRDMTLNGEAADAESHKKAIELTSSVTGIRSVSDEIKPFAVVPYSVMIGLKDDELLIDGYVPSKESQAEIATIVKQRYPGKTVAGSLNVANGSPEKWPELVSVLVKGIASMDHANVNLMDKALNIDAQTEKTADRTALMNALKPFEQYGYNISSQVVSLEAAILLCQEQFNKLLSATKISFNSGKAVLTSSSIPVLKNLAEAAGGCPGVPITVAGHTDNLGSEQANFTLSLERAKAVAAWLAGAGIRPELVKTVGYGPQRPIADNATKTGRAKNRRIEFTINEK